MFPLFYTDARNPCDTSAPRDCLLTPTFVLLAPFNVTTTFPREGLSAQFAADGTRSNHEKVSSSASFSQNCWTSHALFRVGLVPLMKRI